MLALSSNGATPVLPSSQPWPTPPPTPLPPNSLVTTSLFSASLGLFLFCYNLLFYILLIQKIFGLTVWHVGSWFPDQGSNLHTLHWKVKS